MFRFYLSINTFNHGSHGYDLDRIPERRSGCLESHPLPIHSLSVVKKMPWSIPNLLITDHTDTTRIKPQDRLSQIPSTSHPLPIRGNKCLCARADSQNVLHCSFLLELHLKTRLAQASPRQLCPNHLQFQHRPPSHSKASAWLSLRRSCNCLESQSRLAKSTGCSTPRPSPSGFRQSLNVWKSAKDRLAKACNSSAPSARSIKPKRRMAPSVESPTKPNSASANW